MERIKQYLKFIIPIIVFFICAIVFVYNSVYEVKEDEAVVTEEKKEEKIKESDSSVYYYVDIKGCVKKPGVYKMKENSRVIDVINESGGLNDNADTSIINLSKKVSDEMFIIIYSKEEIDKYKTQTISTSEINKKIEESIIFIDKNNDAEIKIEDNISEESKTININTASKEELQTISGVGESKAKAIIKYREENGNFESIEDIKKVSGIGDSLFEKIKEYITV